MSEMKSISLAVEEAVTDQLNQLEKRDRFNLKLLADQRRLIKDLRRQIKEFSSYVNSGKQQIDMIKLAVVVEKFQRLDHVIKLVGLIPGLQFPFVESSHILHEWVNPGITLTDDIEAYAADIICLEKKIMGAAEKAS